MTTKANYTYHGNRWTIHASQPMMLGIFDSHRGGTQLHLNKTGKEKDFTDVLSRNQLQEFLDTTENPFGQNRSELQVYGEEAGRPEDGA